VSGWWSLVRRRCLRP